MADRGAGRPTRSRRPLTTAGAAVPALLLAAGLAGCLPAGDEPAAVRAQQPGGRAVLAFAGDVHFEGASAAALDEGLGSAAGRLAAADLAVVNLETAVTAAGDRQPKQYAFRAPAVAFDVLAAAGVDAVSLANNHGMDFGRAGLLDSLAAADAAGVDVLGAGRDVADAREPLRRTVGGVRVSVLAATDVLDSFAIGSWPATADRPGIVSAKSAADLERLVAAVTAEKAEDRADVVAVMLHWGVETRVCPTARQRDLATRLAAAGADVVVGSHAHVVQPDTTVGRTAVHYGTGNFVFYARGGRAVESGVWTVTVTRQGVAATAWEPATIRAGRPALLSGAARDAAVAAQQSRGARC